MIWCSPEPLHVHGAKMNIFIPAWSQHGSPESSKNSTLIFLNVHHILRPTLSLWAKYMKRSWGISLKLQNRGLWLKEFAVSGSLYFRAKFRFACSYCSSLIFPWIASQHVSQFSPILTVMFVGFLSLHRVQDDRLLICRQPWWPESEPSSQPPHKDRLIQERKGRARREKGHWFYWFRYKISIRLHEFSGFIWPAAGGQRKIWKGFFTWIRWHSVFPKERKSDNMIGFPIAATVWNPKT